MIKFVLYAAVLYNCFQNALQDELPNQETENIPKANVGGLSFISPVTKGATKIFDQMHDVGEGLVGLMKNGAQNIGRLLPFPRR